VYAQAQVLAEHSRSVLISERECSRSVDAHDTVANLGEIERERLFTGV
jgi:hypothetical protein